MISMVQFVLLMVIVVHLVAANCPQIAYQEGDPSLLDVSTLSVYLDPSDDEFEEGMSHLPSAIM